MKHYFLIILSIIITQPILGQFKLTVIQEGKKGDLMNVPIVFGREAYPCNPTRINDSTLEYTLKITEPTNTFILIDTVSHGDSGRIYNWYTYLWADPEVKRRELVINYSTRKLKIHDITTRHKTNYNLHEWDSITQVVLQLEGSQRFDEEENVVIPYIEKHPDSYLSLWLFESRAIYIESNEKKLSVFNKLSPSLSIYPEYYQMQGDLTGRKYPNAGDTFKEFTLVDVNGKVFNSAAIKNKWILLHFWCNCCGPCVHEMDSMVSYYKTLDTSKIAFISVALDNNRDYWKKTLTTQKIKWTNLWEKDGVYGDLCLNYNLPAIPYFVLFDSDKKLVVMQDGADALDTTIKAYLRKVK